MRNVLTISLPQQMVKLIKNKVRSGKYASVSEYFRDLIRQQEIRRKDENLESIAKELSNLLRKEYSNKKLPSLEKQSLDLREYMNK